MSGDELLAPRGNHRPQCRASCGRPFATRQLPDLGARGIKIEHTDLDDFARQNNETVHGQADYFV